LNGSAISFTDSVAAGADNLFAVNVSSGTTPATLTVSLIPSELPILCPVPGSAGGYLVVTPSTGLKILIQLTLNTTAAPLLINPSSLSFAYQVGQAPPANQTLSVTSSTLLPFSVKTSYTAGAASNWLNVTPASGTTPGNLTVSLNSSALATAASGQYQATVGIASTTCSIDPDIVVTLTLTGATTSPFSVTPNPLSFSYQPGEAPPSSQTLTVNSTVAETFTVGGVPSWLTVTPTSGTTPATLSVSVNGIPTSSQVGTFDVTASGATVSVTVTLTVGQSFSLNPPALNFAAQTGGASPAAEPLVLTVIGAGQTYTATASYQPSSHVTNPDWLNLISPTGTVSGTSPGIISANVNPTGLPEGTYNATVTVLSGSSSATASVNLLVSDKPVITSSGGAIIFNVPVGSSTPTPSQTLQLTSTDDATPLPLSVSASSTANWLTSAVEPIAMTPATVTLSVNPSAASLDVGTYVDTVNIFASTTPTGTPQITVPAILNITPLAGPTTPEFTTVLNSASDIAGAISPGEIISIFGTNIGPATPAYLTLTAGNVSTTLAGTQVLFDNVAAPLIYASATQINAIVPYEIAGRAVTSVSVIVNKTPSAELLFSVADTSPSAELLFSVADTSPAIFTGTENGTGQGAILNQDGTVNSANNPAAPGSTVSIYGTGGGQTDPPGVTGSVTTGTPPFPVLAATPVSVTIGGQNAQIEYAGAAPGLVSGVLQVNVKIPTNAGSGAVPIVVSVGGVNSQANVTVSLH
jgi:uncharacterized protein (TIGR03437 family)